MTTYTVITTIESATGTHTETATRCFEGDVEAIREAVKFVASPGDTVTHRVIEEG